MQRDCEEINQRLKMENEKRKRQGVEAFPIFLFFNFFMACEREHAGGGMVRNVKSAHRSTRPDPSLRSG